LPMPVDTLASCPALCWAQLHPHPCNLRFWGAQGKALLPSHMIATNHGHTHIHFSPLLRALASTFNSRPPLFYPSSFNTRPPLFSPTSFNSRPPLFSPSSFNTRPPLFPPSSLHFLQFPCYLPHIPVVPLIPSIPTLTSHHTPALPPASPVPCPTPLCTTCLRAACASDIASVTIITRELSWMHAGALRAPHFLPCAASNHPPLVLPYRRVFQMLKRGIFFIMCPLAFSCTAPVLPTIPGALPSCRFPSVHASSLPGRVQFIWSQHPA